MLRRYLYDPCSQRVTQPSGRADDRGRPSRGATGNPRGKGVGTGRRPPAEVQPPPLHDRSATLGCARVCRRLGRDPDDRRPRGKRRAVRQRLHKRTRLHSDSGQPRAGGVPPPARRPPEQAVHAAAEAVDVDARHSRCRLRDERLREDSPPLAQGRPPRTRRPCPSVRVRSRR